jgi:hypothetical protein
MEQWPSRETSRWTDTKFPEFYRTRWVITTFIRATHWSLSKDRQIHSTLRRYKFLGSILIINSHLDLDPICGLFIQESFTELRIKSTSSPCATYPAHHTFMDFIIQIKFSGISNCETPQRVIFWGLIMLKSQLRISFSIPCLMHPYSMAFL